MGQGLAGSLLAWELEKAGSTVAIIDRHRAGAASRVASGMWNPLTFRLVLKSWRADTLLPVAMEVYTDLCAHFGAEWLHPVNISRSFPDQAYVRLWEEKLLDPAYDAYVRLASAGADTHARLRYPAGRGEVAGAGWLELPPLLAAIRKHFKLKDALFETEFAYADIRLQSDGINWQGVEACKLIFAEGSLLQQNPWFNWIPLKPAQGDVLTLRIPELRLEQIYNAGFFILPLGHDQYRVGATYEWDVLSKLPTEAGKAELLDKFTKAYSGHYEVIDHQSGIRPTVADRRPLLGIHPAHPALGVFNGLGTKGVMTGPYFARQMAAFLQGKSTIEAEADILRFRKRYEKSREAAQKA